MEDLSMVVGDYKPGSIREIRVKNFLTYGEAVIRPGPRYVRLGGEAFAVSLPASTSVYLVIRI